LCESIETQIRANPKDLGPGMDMVAVLKNLERCADLATNIAEDVVYTVDGNIIRHPSLARRTNP
jgi:phosphate transport system protein